MTERTTLLSKRATTTLYRVDGWGGDERRGAPVVFKVLDAEQPGLEQLGRFLHELSVTQRLAAAGVGGVRRGLARTRFEGRHAIVLEYIEGRELAAQPAVTDRARLLAALDLGAQLAHTLAQLHAQRVIHRDLKPTNVLVDVEGRPHLIDLGLATDLDVRATHLGNPALLEGTLLYMAPEQTGRMNHTVDYRADLYSLGATLYEVLTGQPPFVSRDPLELVHAHLARRPRPPHELNAAVPEAASRVVLRLLEKNPSDRYQSATGVASDLRAILESLRQGGTLDDLVLGRADAPTRFTVPEQLYGREAQREALLEAFGRAQGGRVELVSVAGPSGVGKSALVGEVHRPMTAQRGNAIRGKFDQLARAVPYSALTRAFTDFIELLLTCDEHELAVWRAALGQAVGDLGRVLLGLMPNLELVLGPLPEVVALEGTAAQNRLRWVMRAFVRAASRPEHPLVLFLDDLQWADLASIELLEALLTEPESKHLLVIAAYRDSEAPPEHPLHSMIEAVTASGVHVTALRIDNLSEHDVAALLADSTRAPWPEAAQLARVVHEKTRGNAFFVHQFLTMLAERGLLRFDPAASRWRFQTEEVASIQVTDNVVDLLTAKLRTLDHATQALLQRAASIGNRFDLTLLSTLTGRPAAELGRALLPALAAGLITPLGRGYLEVEAAAELAREVRAEYGFAHDRIQQAAYALVPEPERAAVHLAIGRSLHQRLDEPSATSVFEVVRHFNAATALLDDPAERLAVAALNLRAGRHAFAAGAFAQSTEHADRGLALLPADAWRSAYDTAAGLHLLASQVAALRIDEPRLRASADAVLTHGRTGLEKSRVYGDLALLAMTQEDLSGAVELGRRALHELGVKFPSRPTTPHIVFALGRVKLTLRGRVEELAELPPLDDPRVEGALMLMDRLLPAAFRSGSKLFPLFVFEMVRLTVQHGLSPYAVASFASYAIAQCAVLKDYETGYRFARTSLRVRERHAHGMGHAVFGIFICHWKEPLVASVEAMRVASRQALEIGDLYQGVWSVCYSVLFMYVSGSPLPSVLEAYRASSDLMRFDEGAVGMRRMITQVITNLTVPRPQPQRLEGDEYNEAWVRKRFRERNDATEIGHYHTFSLQLCVFFGHTEEGLVHADAVEQHIDGLNPMYFWPLMHFLSAIVRLRAYRASRSSALLRKVQASIKVLARCAAQNPVNYEHLAAIVDAELASVTDRRDAAARHDRAIALTRKHSAPQQDQALALELASEFHRRAGETALADRLREQAAHEYLLWGATVLSDRLGGVPRSIRVSPESRRVDSSSSSSTSAHEAALDLMSVMKASQAISGSLVLDDLLKQLLRTLIENAGAQRGLLILKGDRELVAEADSSHGESRLDPRPIEDRPDLARSILRYVERTLQSVVLSDAASHARFASDPYLARVHPRSLLCMPIIRQQRLVGLLYLENDLATGAFTAERCRVLELLSVQAAISLENARLYDTLDHRVKERTQQLRESLERLERTQAALDAELSDAAAYVRSLLPAPLSTARLRTSWRYVPSAYLGGDGLGYVLLDDGRFAFYVLDIAGHGIASALLCISVLTALHARRLPGADFGDPASVLRSLNEAFPVSTSGGRHFTIWYGVLDPTTGELVCANAGHPNAVVCSASGEQREIGDPGIMLGILPSVDPTVARATLLPGDRVFVFSDGAYEVERADGTMLSYDEFLGELRAAASRGGVEHLLRYALGASSQDGLEDDFSMLCVDFAPTHDDAPLSSSGEAPPTLARPPLA